MIDDWIDTLTRVWEVDDGRGGTVQAYRLFERDEFPEEVPLDRPTALTFVDNVEVEYSLGGPALAFWTGTTEFNLTPDLNKQRIPYVLRFIERIIRAAAANLTLGGRVNFFIINTTISLEPLQYGNQAPHLGLVVAWRVKEHIDELVVTP